MFLKNCSLTLFATLFIGALIVTGCSSQPPKPKKPLGSESSKASVDDMLQDTELLDKAKEALEQRNFVQARQYLEVLNNRRLVASTRIKQRLLAAEVELEAGELDAAKQYLSLLKPPTSRLKPEESKQRDTLIARWYEAKANHLAAARQRIFLASDLSGAQYYLNHELIWKNLMQVEFVELKARAKGASATDFGDWLELASLVKNPQRNLDERAADIKAWQKRHYRHPAAMKLPGRLALLKNMDEKALTNVALLLPLSGKLAKVGAVIRDGFMASYYQAVSKGQNVPEIQVLDSQSFETLDDAYAKALELGAQWVVGPVDKQKVSLLHQQSTLALPTLALNYVDEKLESKAPISSQYSNLQSATLSNKSSAAQTATNLYQFGLSASDEAISAANQAWADGHKSALVLVPKGQWGQRIAHDFEQHWEKLGGVISGRRYYPRRKDYNPDIRALLNVDGSQRRYDAIRKTLPEKVEFEPRARQDADWLFMVALPSQAKQIKPTLAFNFSANLPVYSTSHLYAGKHGRASNSDLNGVVFCDAPWFLAELPLHTKINQAIGTQGAYARLYALGADAFNLLPKTLLFEAIPHSHIQAYTGTLHMDDKRKVHRSTDCAIFDKGEPKLLSEIEQEQGEAQ